MSEVELTEAVPSPVEIRNQKPLRVRLADELIQVQVVRFSMSWGDMFGLIFKFLICVTPARRPCRHTFVGCFGVLSFAALWGTLGARLLGAGVVVVDAAVIAQRLPHQSRAFVTHRAVPVVDVRRRDAST